MTSFIHMGAVARRSLAAAIAALGAAAAQADPIQWSTGQVSIAFDADTFSFFSDSTFTGLESVSPVISLSGQGVVLDFGGNLSAYASSYDAFGADSREASLDALFSFTPEAGYAITGYTITYKGGYAIETPGSVALYGHSGTTLFNASLGGNTIHLSDFAPGPIAPQLTGHLSASGDVTYVEVFDHFEEVYSHDEEVLDYCETEEPFTCYYRHEPVYIQEPVYRYEMDLGDAHIYINSIAIEAQVAAVPEPETLALALAGLAVVGWGVRRRARAT